jgi:hypothetical protein
MTTLFKMVTVVALVTDQRSNSGECTGVDFLTFYFEVQLLVPSGGAKSPN